MELLGFILIVAGVLCAFAAGVFWECDGMLNAMFLFIASLVLHFLSCAVIATWYVDEVDSRNTCPVCHQEYEEEYKYCPIDGAEIEVDVE